MNAVIPLKRREGHVYDIDLVARFVMADFAHRFILLLLLYLAYSSVSFCSLFFA